MNPIRLLSASAQVAAHLRGVLECGGWSDGMPGVNRLAAELGVNRKTVVAALRQLEKEGVLSDQGQGRKRLIDERKGNAVRPMRIAILEFYSQHTMAEAPQEFGPAARFNIGKRHRKQTDPAHFAGAIDDARIYDQALSAEQIAALKPNDASAVKPWAWWSFDDKEDRAGRFAITELTGGAKTEDGKLVLDGISGGFMAGTGKEPPFTPETPARPAAVPANWLTYHLAHPGPGQGWPGGPNCAFFWQGRYHLHYIYNHRDGFRSPTFPATTWCSGSGTPRP